MTNSAERPLIGPGNEQDDPSLTGGTGPARRDTTTDQSGGQFSVRKYSSAFEIDYPSQRLSDGQQPDDQQTENTDDDDGPVIRRITSPRPATRSTPRLFSGQLGEPDGALDDFEPVAAPPLHATRPTYDQHTPRARADRTVTSGASHSTAEFSVAAIREKRMRTPAGTHRPTSLATKATVATLASICLVSAGMALGLYGQEIRRGAESAVLAATGQVAHVINQIAAAGADDKATASAAQASLAGNSSSGSGPAALPVAEASAVESDRPANGRKLIYKRLPTAEAAEAQTAKPEREALALPASAGSGGAFNALLAPPADFAANNSQVD